MQLAEAFPPASWTIVMTSGVVSVDLYSVHQLVLSAIMLWFAAALWLLLVAVLAAPLVCQHGRFAREARSPVALTSVAATAVLGTRLTVPDYRLAAAALLALAAIGWAVLLGPVLRHWKTPTTGVSFVLGVATNSLALLSAILAVAYRAGWLLSAAVVFLLLALACYVFTAARFDLRQLISGQGDHWIAGGALAIAALTTGKTAEAASALGWFAPRHQVLTVGTLVLWCLAMAWLPVLIASEVVRPRLSYDVRRWATVFPLGMYAACSFTVGQVTGINGITIFGRVWTWVAFAATLVALAGLVQHIRQAPPRVPADVLPQRPAAPGGSRAAFPGSPGPLLPPAEGTTRWIPISRPGTRSRSTGKHRNAEIQRPSTPSTPRTRSLTTRSRGNGSGAGRRSPRSAAVTPPPGTSPCCVSPAAGNCG
jgi:tellurite resistance protein TehA-like permease